MRGILSLLLALSVGTFGCLSSCDGVLGGGIDSVLADPVDSVLSPPVDDGEEAVGVQWTIPPVFEYAAYLETGANNDPIETPACRGTLCSTLALTEATLAKRPTLKLTCPVGATTKPCLYVDGADDHVDTTPRAELAFLHNGTGATCLVIAEATNAAYAALLATSGIVATDRGFNLYRTNTNGLAATIGDGINQSGTSTASVWAINETHPAMTIDLVADTPDFSSFITDFTTAIATNSRAHSALTSTYPLGLYGKHGHTAAYYFTGYIQLVACWAQRLTTAQREAEQVNLETYFGGTFPL